MDILKLISTSPVNIRSRLRRLSQRPQCPCHFLQLPPELIYLISEFIPPVSRTLLSQTCSSLRTILGDRAAAVHLSPGEYLEYLTGIARERCDRWVCETCIALHPVMELDVPANSQHMSCPYGWAEWKYRTYGIGECRLDPCLLELSHRHIQLALKYTRTQNPRYRAYLKQLLRPYYESKLFTLGLSLESQTPVSVDYQVQPRVVKDADDRLRFLLMSVWRYATVDQDLSITTIGYLRICPHLRFGWCLFRQIIPGNILEAAVAAAFDRRAEEVHGACPRCRTDFSIQVFSKSAELRVWQDMGPEVSPMDPAWRSHVWQYKTSCYGGPNYECVGLIVHHEPGSIRTLYHGGEQEEKKGAVWRRWKR